jgi:hypothetical protein
MIPVRLLFVLPSGHNPEFRIDCGGSGGDARALRITRRSRAAATRICRCVRRIVGAPDMLRARGPAWLAAPIRSMFPGHWHTRRFLHLRSDIRYDFYDSSLPLSCVERVRVALLRELESVMRDLVLCQRPQLRQRVCDAFDSAIREDDSLRGGDASMATAIRQRCGIPQNVGSGWLYD